MMKMKMITTTTTMMMMMMMMTASAGPLPPSLNQNRHDDQDLHLLENRGKNATRYESHHNVSESEGVASVGVTSMGVASAGVASAGEVTGMEPEMSNSSDVGTLPVVRHALHGCFLSTCLTANLGSSLQVGEETAGSAASSAFGNGRK